RSSRPNRAGSASTPSRIFGSVPACLRSLPRRRPSDTRRRSAEAFRFDRLRAQSALPPSLKLRRTRRSLGGGCRRVPPKPPAAASRLVDDIVRSGVTFDDAYRTLKRGRNYPARATGMVRLINRPTAGPGSVDHHFALNVPASYDPTRKYQVRFQLHGGVGG